MAVILVECFSYHDIVVSEGTPRASGYMNGKV
jgi:hypothetical protein